MKTLLTSLLALLTAAPCAFSATRTWTGASSGSWGSPSTSDSANWTGGVLPGNGDLLVFPPGAHYIGVVTHDLPLASSAYQGIIFQTPGYDFWNPVFGLGIGISSTIAADFQTAGPAIMSSAVRLDGAASFIATGSLSELRIAWPVNLNGKTLTVAGNGRVQFEGGVNNPGNIVKNGAGLMVLNCPLTHGGGFVINSGTVSCLDATMMKPVNMNGGRLTGTGAVLNVTVGSGTLEPGDNGAGTLTVNGTAQCSAASTLALHLSRDLSGGTKVVTQGGFTAGGSLHLTFVPAAAPLAGQEITLVDNQSAAATGGTFAGLPEGGTLTQDGIIYRISYTGGTGNDVTLAVAGAVASGVERVWTGAVDSQWTTPGNWAGGIAPQPGDAVQFPEVAAAKKLPVNNFPAGWLLYRVRLLAGGYQLSGNAVHLNDGLVQQAPAGSAANVVKLPLSGPAAAAKTTTVRLQAGGHLTLEPVAAFHQPYVSDALVLQNDQPGALLTSRMSLSGAGTLAKSGAGPVVLDAASTHTGGVRVYAGELRAPQATFTGSGLVSIDAGAVLATGHPGLAKQTFTNAANLSGSIRGMGYTAWDGPVQTFPGDTAQFIAEANQDFEVSGAISGQGSVQFAGPGECILNGTAPNTHTGLTIVQGSVLKSTKPAGVTAIPGSLQITTGRMEVMHADQIADAATVMLQNGGAFYVRAEETISALHLSGGSVARAFAPLTVTNAVQSSPGAQKNFLTGTFVAGIIAAEWNIADGAAEPDLEFNGTLTRGPAGTGRIQLTGGGKMQVLDGTAADHPDIEITLSAGTLEWNDLPAGGAPFGPDMVLHGGTLTGTGCVRRVSATGGGVLAPGGVPGTFQSGDVTLQPAAAFRVDCDAAAADQLQITGTLTLAGAPLIPAGTPPDYGQPLVIIANDGTDPVSGTFAALPRGGRIPFRGAMLEVNYSGGDGNDVTLTRVPPPAPENPVISLTDWMQSRGALPVTASATGLPGFTCVLESSEDLTTWQTVATDSSTGFGNLTFSWLPPAGLPRLFLRIRAL